MNLTLSSNDWLAISPLLIMLAGASFLLLLESFAAIAARKWSILAAIITLVIAGWATVAAPASSNPLLTPWLRFDLLAKFFTLFFLCIGLAVVLLSSTFFQRFSTSHGEYFFLLLTALLGLIFIGAAADFLTLFLGIETLSISLYILCGYIKRWDFSSESALKYFFMGALATAFLLYGIALIYGAIGTTQFDQLFAGYQSISSNSNRILFLCGISLVTLGLAFEAAIVPFHVWAPDVYAGAPTPVTAFMAVGTKVGAFAALVRVFLGALPDFDPLWNEGISLLVYPTLIYANMVALRQTQLRRFFAYSGISHAGFLLIPFAAGTADALPAITFYLVIYALATIGCFSILALVDKRANGVILSDLNGFFKHSPCLAGIFALCLLTLAGIPPTAGFFAKFYIFKIAFQSGYYAIVIVGLLTTILAAYYYLRIISAMLTDAPGEAEIPLLSKEAIFVGVVSAAVIVGLSCYPAPLMELLALKAS